MRRVLFAVLAIHVAFPLYAYGKGESFISDHERGWFFYEEEPEEPEKKEEKKPVEVAKKEEKPDPWVPRPRDDVEEPLKLLFNDPQKNARNFLIYMNRLSNKGIEIAEAVKKALDEDPSLFPIMSPSSTYASTWLAKYQSALKDKVLDKNKGRIGIVFFLREDSPASLVQIKIGNLLFRDGYQVIGITPESAYLPGAMFPVQPDGGVSSVFGVKEVPSVYLVDMKLKKHVKLGRGISTMFQIQDSILNYLEAIGEWKPVTPVNAWDDKNPIYKTHLDYGFNPFYLYDLAQKEGAEVRKMLRERGIKGRALANPRNTHARRE